MLTSFSTIPKLITIEDALDDFYGNVFDMAYPFSLSHRPELYSYRRFFRKPKDDKYRIVVEVGKNYQPKDVKTSLDKNNLKVTGEAVEKVPYGSNSHHFERTYTLPEYVDLTTMKSELNQYGEIQITFDRKVVEPRKEIENLSTETDYCTRFNIPGFKPEELSVKLLGRDLVIEGEHKSERASENGQSYSSLSGTSVRRIRLDDSVDTDKLRAVLSPEGGIEVRAPRDPSRLKKQERRLEIEKS